MHPTEFLNVRLLKEIAEFINEETEIETMLSGALRKFLQGTKFETGWIFFISDSGKQQLIVSENLPEALAQNGCSQLKNGGCWCVTKYREGKLEKASNIIECQRIENVLAAKIGDNAGITHHATVPLQSGQERFGLVNVASPNTISYSKGELALLESLAFQLGSAIKRILLTKQEQEIALLQERNRLAKDLHDSVNQLLFSVTLTARGGAEMTSQADIKETFKEIQNLSQEALNEMRALIWQLRPSGLESGLIEAIKGYGEMLGLTVHSNVSGVMNVPARVEEALFRISQEALNNIRKHAGVTFAEIFLNVTKTDVLLVIKDAGHGFLFNDKIRLSSMGLQSMKDRAKNAGGSIEWDSEIGRGTEILVRIPY
ncbi:GAF domain-containing sensor histidine kinase [Sporosarcina sp. ACRSL]|uniref:GAF domain-containing sensor histidine kinase n=1 Tax=Sporosarcina sp. ACRSL TaxID=2918215 RepID=UPI001EF6DF5D|nr:GAF domain-containing sensor histidine kinase [Sporosarcina sp. ACRSL]MCG7343748.1 GAF domain-containing sensor histidine kinase [Sporosarcina sp. ACRSL]